MVEPPPYKGLIQVQFSVQVCYQVSNNRNTLTPAILLDSMGTEPTGAAHHDQRPTHRIPKHTVR